MSIWTTELQVSFPLPEDVLYHIFECDALCDTLPAVALVCHMWTTPAQCALYRDITFSTAFNRRREANLARTMRTCPHVRRYVRRLTLLNLWTHLPTPGLYDWIELLPSYCLYEFQWTWMRGHVISSVLRYPAIQTVTRLQLKGPIYTAATLQHVLELPQLESLALQLAGTEEGELYPPHRSRLKHLDVYLSFGYGPAFEKLLAAVGAQLQSFRLACRMGYEPDADAQLVAALATYCVDVRCLSVSALFMRGIPTPFMDGLVGRLRALEYVCCAEGTYSARLFERLPVSLKGVEFAFTVRVGGLSWFPYEDALLGWLSSVRACGQRLASVAFVLSGADACSAGFGRIDEACRASGVAFHDRM